MALPATRLNHRSGHDAGPPDAVLSFAARHAAERRSGLALKTAAELQSALEFQDAERVLALGIPALDAALPLGGLPQGSVIELQVQGASGAATSFALCACRAAQNRAVQSATPAAGERRASGLDARQRGRIDTESPRAWCAFIDPSASLFAPGVARLGVDLARLLVVRPEPEAIERVAIRIAEARAVSLLVIDSRGALDGRDRARYAVSNQRWQRTVRRLALAIKQLTTTILLITPAEQHRSLPLPVAMRLEFSRAGADSVELRVGKERSGRVSSARAVPWSAFEPAWH